MRFIEVKTRANLGSMVLTTNEYKTAQPLGLDYWLYVVFDCPTKPKIHCINNPIKLGWQPIVQVEHYRVDYQQILTTA